MKRIVICLDGTWNQVGRSKTATNVVHIAQAVKPTAHDGTPQPCYYNSGVGTGDWIDKVLGGVFGRGVKSNVKRAYAFLSLNYEPGDEIYIFGFSRGSYTARALAGLIGAAGILNKDKFDCFDDAWTHYRTRPDQRDQQGYEHKAIHTPADIRCVGVWDTVGSYGVPAGFGLGGLMRYFTRWQRGFHDTHFSKKIGFGLHALAIDEKRRPFSPTFWTLKQGESAPDNVEQVWFCGVHSNIGGGYPDSGLAQLPLLWMVARVMAVGARKFHGSTIDFDLDYLRDNTKPSPLATLYRSDQYWPVSRILPFRRPVLVDADRWNLIAPSNDWVPNELPINERVHWSAIVRHGSPGAGYAPSNWPANRNPPNSPLPLADFSAEEEMLLPRELLTIAQAVVQPATL
jgi:hypothetical protein